MRRGTAKEPALLLGLYYSSLPIAESLARRGIRVYGIDAYREIGSRSRYVETMDAPAGGDALAEFLESFARRAGSRPVLYPLADDYVMFLYEHQESLAPLFAFPEAPPEAVRSLLDKTEAPAAFARRGIDHPRTLAMRRGEALPPGFASLEYPLVIKPRYKRDWEHNAAAHAVVGEGRLALTVENSEESARAIASLGLISDLVLQEFIPGESEEHCYYVGYRDRGGRISTSYIGRKIRTLPNCLGSETLLRSVHLPSLLELGDSILHRFDYRGPAGIDFKRDPRNGRFKVIEINCRIGINDCYLVKYGLDLPFIYYQDSLGREVEPAREYPEGVTWYDPLRDLEWMRLYARETGARWFPWILRLGSYDTYAVFSRSDPWPSLSALAALFRRGLKRLSRRGAAPRPRGL